MLIFKDPIVGFVSGVQIAANDMIRIGDWVEMPKYDANGEVVDISLTTIKIANFDNTITTVPTYAFISDSFKNWRRMQEKGGRRIKRSILIDINSIKFCTPELIEKFKEINFVTDYVTTMENQFEEFNKQNNISMDELFNGIHLTNIGVFRIYLQNYLNHNEFIHQDMDKIVRQLDPIENGLPLEIYTFSTLTEWEDYERVQSDLFDHIIAIAPEFELRIYQSPSGSDFKSLANQK
jgi:miniconductance mechanosensitive channel